jgi:hypothetical protein
MIETDRTILAHESHLARRLGRLFRAERQGRFSDRPRGLAERLVRRRGELIEALVRTDAARRALDLPISPDLRQAAEALARETAQSIHAADGRLQQLREDLLRSRGDGIPTGIRGSAGGGRIIGRG